jgi:RNA polymerase sigma-70 factor (ECF subfamily)
VGTTDPTPTQAGRLSSEAAGERLSQLFEEHGRMVYGLCRVLLRDADEAEDAAQQVFLSAHRSMLGGTEPREPSAWLAAIARNECHARIRARMATPLTLVVDERDAVGADIEQVAGQHAEVEALCVALAELPKQQREAIVLREFYGLSYDEVRTALGVTDGAVESLLFRARKRLQAELQPARVASGALALPLALRDSIAAAVPGFSAASSGGGLAKLVAAPLREARRSCSHGYGCRHDRLRRAGGPRTRSGFDSALPGSGALGSSPAGECQADPDRAGVARPAC